MTTARAADAYAPHMTMKRTVLTFGLISGAVSSVMMLGTVPFMHRIGFDHGLVVGYTAIVLSFLLVFFGIRSYREQAGGAITFGRAFTVGILITLISCVFYVATWELIYFKLQPEFMDKWEAYAVEKVRADGGTPEAVEATRRQMRSFKVAYDNPLTNAAYTFIEPFPVGLLVTVISAAALRRKPRTA
jgi:Protein of unknown function (DUF4199)